MDPKSPSPGPELLTPATEALASIGAHAQLVRMDALRSTAVSTEPQVVVDTTEVRWFGDGELPSGVTEWFTHAGLVGVVERRCDTYRLDERADLGFKLRSQRTPELKIRQSTEGRLSLGEGRDGRVEVWRKWSPSDERVDDSRSHDWVDVRKTITKRRLSETGVELATGVVPSHSSWVGVDVETVELTVGTIVAWSFAFAAFGPPGRRLSAIATCWEHLLREPPPETLNLARRRSCGYPELLTRQRALEPRSA